MSGMSSIIGQIGAPWSVNSFAQRLGRSGRKEGEPSVLIMFIIEKESKEDSIVERLHPELLRAVAMSELMIGKWNEPPLDRLLPFFHIDPANSQCHQQNVVDLPRRICSIHS